MAGRQSQDLSAPLLPESAVQQPPSALKPRTTLTAASIAEVQEAEAAEPDEPEDDDTSLAGTSMRSHKNQQSELHEIKATTMWRMVQDVTDREGVKRKVIFLTNSQANIITESPDRIKRLVDSLEMPEPKLLINLIPSFDGTEMIFGNNFFGNPGVPGLESVRYDVKPPDKYYSTWESKAEYYRMERKLSDFMRDVVLPLAVETNAVVLCDASYGQCLLAMVFGRVVALRRAEWGPKLPFTIIGCCPAMPLLYKNGDLDANWRYVRANCQQWDMRHKLMCKLMMKNPGWGFCTDLDPNVTAYLLFDSIKESKGAIGILGPGNLLITALTNYFKERIPCIGIKTGMSWKEKAGERYQTGLSVVVDSLSSGIPVVCLDLRPRKLEVTEDMTQEEVVDKAKECWCADADGLNFPDILDACALSFFHTAMVGSLNADDISGNLKEAEPLYAAIKEKEVHQQGLQHLKTMKPGTYNPPDFKMVSTKDYRTFEGKRHMGDVLEWLAENYYQRAWKHLPEDVREMHPDYGEYYCDIIQNWLKQTKFIMSHKDFYCLNVDAVDEGKQRLRDLVKLDRLPPSNSLEGLRLLRNLWKHHDICTHHAQRYKVISKIFYFLQLSFQIALVICGVIYRSVTEEDVAENIGMVPFVVSTIASAIITVNALVNPMRRWRQLRGSSLALESICWKYRTRVDEYAIQPNTPQAPEMALSDSIRSWLDDLVSGTDLDTSDLGRKYPDNVFTHHQYKSDDGPAIGKDDHQSPCKPEAYIELRLLPAKAFYAKRIAPYSWWRYFWMALGLVCTACSSLLSFLGYTMFLGIPSCLANALFAWSEFADINRKMERYNNVVRKLEKLLIWWDGIGEVEKASSANVKKLVLNAESLIAGEYQAWQSIASSGTVSMDGADVSATAPTLMDSSKVNDAGDQGHSG